MPGDLLVLSWALLGALAVLLTVAHLAVKFTRRRVLPCRCRVAAVREATLGGRQFLCAHQWWWARDPDNPDVLLGGRGARPRY